MATINDVLLTGTAYQNLNSVTGLISGTPLVLQNKGTVDVRVILNPTIPAASSENGWLLAPRASIIIENESDPVWAKAVSLGSLRLSVQQFV